MNKVDRNQLQRKDANEPYMLHEAIGDLLKVDPKPWMKSGWTQLMLGGQLLDSVSKVSPGKEVKARLIDGTVTMNVTETNLKS